MFHIAAENGFRMALILSDLSSREMRLLSTPLKRENA
jgi:hypothetical protein